MNAILMNAIKTGKQTSLFSRFSNRAVAIEMSNKQTYPVEVLLGDDGYFWVAASGRIQGMLQKLGYEVA